MDKWGDVQKFEDYTGLFIVSGKGTFKKILTGLFS